MHMESLSLSLSLSVILSLLADSVSSSSHSLRALFWYVFEVVFYCSTSLWTSPSFQRRETGWVRFKTTVYFRRGELMDISVIFESVKLSQNEMLPFYVQNRMKMMCVDSLLSGTSVEHLLYSLLHISSSENSNCIPGKPNAISITNWLHFGASLGDE